MREYKYKINENGESFFTITNQVGSPRLPEPENERLRRKRQQWREASKLRYLKNKHPELFFKAEQQRVEDRKKAEEEYFKELENRKRDKQELKADKLKQHKLEVEQRKEARRLESERTKPEREG